jgi:hypothetical protein
MRFIDSPSFPQIVGLALVVPAVFFKSRGWIADGPEMAIAAFGVFLVIDGVVWERFFGADDGGPLAEKQLLHSFGWAKRRYAAALLLIGLASVVFYFYGREGWQAGVVMIVVPITYLGLLAFDLIRAMHVVDERVTGKSWPSDTDHCG